MNFTKLLWIFLLLFVSGCQSNNRSSLAKLSIGAVSLGEDEVTINQYKSLKTYLSNQLNTTIELEPTFNERKAIEQIRRNDWDLVFAPPGLAAIAISEAGYQPIFPLEGNLKARSIIAVREDSPLSKLSDLASKVLALGEPGSATRYYFPIYNLYGLTLGEVRFAPTPEIALNWLADKEVDAAALSLDDFNHHRVDHPNEQFRVLHADLHPAPTGSVIISTNLEEADRETIREALANASPAISDAAGYVPNVTPPNYDYLIEVVERVVPIAQRIQQQPAPLYEVE